ncbi:MAG: gamma carbonic anhydrase family protein [Rhodospirillaceae bacterium]|nr:gamma carbonic anhydrase family protein [Rhodospirillaceae bacterium]|tara:strand:+ start:161 stop:694 length:534 start_codon:yes stop_codon:yes gene_type:complete
MNDTIIIQYRGIEPNISSDAFVFPGVFVSGDVTVLENAAIFPGCVLRGDVAAIHVGRRTNIQDCTVVHVSSNDGATWIGDEVTIGHHCLIHACTLEDRSFIGMRATVMDKAVVETGAMVAAGALVTPGKRVPSGELWAGNPAKKMRDLSPKEQAGFMSTVDRYAAHGQAYRDALKDR